MWWDDPDDDKNHQRLKNGIFLSMPVSNETREEMLPVLAAVTALGLVAFLIYEAIAYLFGW